MTRKDYIKIATIFRDYQDKLIIKKSKVKQQMLLNIIIDFDSMLSSDNPQFNEDKFLSFINRL
jgi:hypothetical protein